MDDHHIMYINSISCVTLGHNFKDEVVAHEYFGSQKVINDLDQCEQDENGIIDLIQRCITRSDETNLVIKIQQTH